MAWDLALDTNGDMTGDLVNGHDEILQRVKTRLGRFLGEWFLDETVGLPWLTEILGGKDRSRAALLIRGEILNTEGVARIVRFEPLWGNQARNLSLYCELALEDGTIHTLVYDGKN